jgi:hypothetical protein
VARLGRREVGISPLARSLRRAGVAGLRAEKLRAMARGNDIPAWPLVKRIGRACGLPDLSTVQRDWREQYRLRLDKRGCAPLGTEVRVLIAEVAMTAREFSKKLGFSPSVLVRDLRRLDEDRPGRWFHVERILRAAGLAASDRRWDQIHAWWYAARSKG